MWCVRMIRSMHDLYMYVSALLMPELVQYNSSYGNPTIPVSFHFIRSHYILFLTLSILDGLLPLGS